MTDVNFVLSLLSAVIYHVNSLSSHFREILRSEKIDHPCRVVSESEKCELQSALEELKITITTNPDKSTFGTTFSQGFSSELISDVVEHSSRLFSLEDILTHTPVFNLDHAIQIFEVIACLMILMNII